MGYPSDRLISPCSVATTLRRQRRQRDLLQVPRQRFRNDLLVAEGRVTCAMEIDLKKNKKMEFRVEL